MSCHSDSFRSRKACYEVFAQSPRYSTGKESKPFASTPESSQPVAGWKAAGTCELPVKDGVLIVTSTGGDPHLSFTLPAPVAESPLVLHLGMSSDASGGAQIYWQEWEVPSAFHRDRSQSFEVKHDQAVHDYSVEFSPQSSLLAVRIDPCSGPGDVKILKMHLSTQSGRLLHTWTF